MLFVDMRVIRKAAPLTDRGFTFECRYTLNPPFSQASLDEQPVE
jgi:hypothetical protein